MWSSSGQYPTGTPPTEESGPLAENAPLTSYEPNILDDFHYSETTEIFFQGNPATRCPRTCLTRNSTTRPSAERSLHHCSFRSEKNQRTEDKLITQLKKSLLPAQSLSVCHARTGRPELSSLSSRSREKSSRDSENEQIRILLNGKRSKFSLILEQRFTNTGSKPILIGEVSRN